MFVSMQFCGEKKNRVMFVKVRFCGKKKSVMFVNMWFCGNRKTECGYVEKKEQSVVLLRKKNRVMFVNIWICKTKHTYIHTMMFVNIHVGVPKKEKEKKE